jgi:RHS repeat-associated protein
MHRIQAGVRPGRNAERETGITSARAGRAETIESMVSTLGSAGPASSLGYDQANRLVSYSGIATYAYNGDGLRMPKAINGATANFAWDQSGSLPLVLTSGAVNYIYGPGDQPIEQVSGTTVTYLQADQQGSVRLLTSSTGTVVGTYSYTPYGQPIRHTGTVATALEYDGQYTDAESGFIYLQARYYEPGTSQFLTVDPAVNLTNSPYAYASDNPVNAADPTGLTWWQPWTWNPTVKKTVDVAATVVGLGAAAVALAGAAPVIVTGLAVAGVALSVVDVAETCPGNLRSVDCAFSVAGLVGGPIGKGVGKALKFSDDAFKVLDGEINGIMSGTQFIYHSINQLTPPPATRLNC